MSTISAQLEQAIREQDESRVTEILDAMPITDDVPTNQENNRIISSLLPLARHIRNARIIDLLEITARTCRFNLMRSSSFAAEEMRSPRIDLGLGNRAGVMSVVPNIPSCSSLPMSEQRSCLSRIEQLERPSGGSLAAIQGLLPRSFPRSFPSLSDIPQAFGEQIPIAQQMPIMNDDEKNVLFRQERGPIWDALSIAEKNEWRRQWDRERRERERERDERLARERAERQARGDDEDDIYDGGKIRKSYKKGKSYKKRK